MVRSACSGSGGNATGPTPSTPSDGARSSTAPAAKTSPGRRMVLSNEAYREAASNTAWLHAPSGLRLMTGSLPPLISSLTVRS